MTRFDVAELLERYARKVEHLPGVSRINPHVFAEAKSELVGDLRSQAKDLRTVATRPAATTPIRPGTRVINGRKVPVELRRA